ncbi:MULTISPECIES: RCC1 domain-containing protein [Corallococcus]|nr:MULTISPECIES: RCC1 domain-containing protein [Corallococcus]
MLRLPDLPHSLALVLRSDGTVQAWGEARYGQRGDGYSQYQTTLAAHPSL